MSLAVRTADPHDDRSLHDYLHAYLAAEHANDPDRTPYTLADTRAVLAGAGQGWRFSAFTAYDGTTPVGSALHVEHLADNPDLLNVTVWVHPDAWGRGVGDALVVHAQERAAVLGRTTVEGQGVLSGPGGAATAAFAARHGYRLVQRVVERELRLPLVLPDVDRDDGYEVRVVVGPIPPELAEGYCAAQNLMNLLAPQGDRQVEATRRTPAILAEQDAEILAQGRERVTALALHDGDVVGYTSGVVTAAGHEYDQWGTLVDPAHRGHGLGLRLKTAQVQALMRERPAVRRIVTSNADDNAAMVAVNDRLGFVVTGAEGVFAKRLAPAEVLAS